jgi:hypothetical protein
MLFVACLGLCFCPPAIKIAHADYQAWSQRDLPTALRVAPAAYANWWLTLVQDDPRHVVVGAWSGERGVVGSLVTVHSAAGTNAGGCAR